MPLDSDVANGDSQLHVEFYTSDTKGWEGKPFVRIVIPGDKNTIIDQPAREDHKERFPRQWLHYQIQQSEGAAAEIGTPLARWHKDAPDEINRSHIEELSILKFVTVEQLALASDQQLQRIMGGVGLRERARQYLNRKNRHEANSELEETKRQLAELQAQIAAMMNKPKRGRPAKVVET